MSGLRQRDELEQALLEMEDALRQLGLWQAQPPPPEALASREPFCVDTLDLHQWLQFILLPRLRQLLRSGAPLPQASDISPMVAEAYRGSHLDTLILETAVARIDLLLGGGARPPG